MRFFPGTRWAARSGYALRSLANSLLMKRSKSKTNRVASPADRPAASAAKSEMESTTDQRLSDRDQTRLVANISTHLWRMKGKMIDSATGQPHDEMRRVYRDLDLIWDELTQVGHRILDHTGEIFSGQSLKVIAFQPTAGIAREMIIETLKPSVYLNDRRLQMGEVVVGTPEPSDGSQGSLSRLGGEDWEVKGRPVRTKSDSKAEANDNTNKNGEYQ